MVIFMKDDCLDFIEKQFKKYHYTFQMIDWESKFILHQVLKKLNTV